MNDAQEEMKRYMIKKRESECPIKKDLFRKYYNDKDQGEI